MKKLYITALMVGAVIFGLLLVGCPDDDTPSTPTFQASRVWHHSGSAVLERSAITKNELSRQDSGESGFSKVVLTVNGLTQANGTMVTLVGGGATPVGGDAEIGIFPEGGDFTGNGIRFAQDENDENFPDSFQKAIANKSVSFTFWYKATDLSGWGTSSTFANTSVAREVAFRLETSDGDNTIFTAEESSNNYYIGGVGEDNTATLTINLGATTSYSLATVNEDGTGNANGFGTATHTDGAATDNGGNIKVTIAISGVAEVLREGGQAAAQFAVAGTNLRYLDGSAYSDGISWDNTPNENLRCTVSSSGTCDLTFFWDPDDADSVYAGWNGVTGALFVFKINLINVNATIESFIYPTGHNQYYVTADDSATVASKLYGNVTTIDAGDTVAFAIDLSN